MGLSFDSQKIILYEHINIYSSIVYYQRRYDLDYNEPTMSDLQANHQRDTALIMTRQ